MVLWSFGGGIGGRLSLVIRVCGGEEPLTGGWDAGERGRERKDHTHTYTYPGCSSSSFACLWRS